MFFCTGVKLRFILIPLTFYKRERVPDPTGVGRPYIFQTSDPILRWWCWVLGSERSQVTSEHGLDVE